MKKYLYFLVILFLSSCNQKNLSDKFINHDSYWAVYQLADYAFNGQYIKFKSDGKSDMYCTDSETNSISKCTGSDLVLDNIPWKVSSDSIFTWGIKKFFIIQCNKNVIIINGGNVNSDIILIKEHKKNLRKSWNYYNNRKYLLNDSIR